MMIMCAQCSGVAAEIVAVMAHSTRYATLWHERARLEQTEFLGTYRWFARPERLEDMLALLQHSEWDMARGLDADMVRFVCRLCDTPYCAACWQQHTVRDHAIWAICPREHWQIIVFLEAHE